MVKPWLKAGENFVLEEDGNSGHGSGIINIVRDWKAEHRLKYYFNCPYSHKKLLADFQANGG